MALGALVLGSLADLIGRRPTMLACLVLMTCGISPQDVLEVQYEPTSGQVITVVARDVNDGRRLGITAADLVDLVHDPRLRLPAL